jgi:hypothetical protein
MFKWFSPAKPEMKPLPLSQREKTYSAQSGYVYQYLFQGLAGEAHIFRVSADRGTDFEIRVELSEDGLLACAERMGSPLRWNEKYALAKLCLFGAFDDADGPEQLKRGVRPGAAELLEHMSTLKMGQGDE